MTLLHRYWFTFETLPRPSPLNLSAGVTAYSYDDAIELMRNVVFETSNLPRIVRCREDVDVSMLDPKHIRPDMGVVSTGGIWFPNGYASTRLTSWINYR